MDLMELRRGLMMGMASGARFEKGSVTIPSNYNGYITINFKNTFNEYLFYIEMDAASKTQLLNSGRTGDMQYALLYKYTTPTIGGVPTEEYKASYRVKPASLAFSASTTNVAIINNITPSSLDIWVRSIGNTYAFYPDYTYNYYVVEIK